MSFGKFICGRFRNTLKKNLWLINIIVFLSEESPDYLKITATIIT